MKFIKPVGAVADLRELEYISALHQTGKTLRKDGTIRSDDIAKYLMSRYGIKVTDDEVSDTIAKGFGGGGVSEEDGSTIDLTEIVAMMLVPTLIKAEMSLHRDHLEQEAIKAGPGTIPESSSPIIANGTIHNYKLHKEKSGTEDIWASTTTGKTRALRGEDRWPDSDLIGFVLDTILVDVTGDGKPKPMTIELLKKIFIFYGEHEVADDDNMLEEMIAIASNIKKGDEESTEPMFDKFTFAHCLTDDVRKYDVKSERRLSTNYADVFEGKGDQEQSCKVATVWTAPGIDYAVDTFRSKAYVILLWVNWALFFYVFMSQSAGNLGQLSCSHDTSTNNGFGCQIAQGVVNWLIIMAKLVIIGSGSVMLCSMGHNINETSTASIIMSILSMGCISLFTFVPAFTSGKFLEDENGVAVVDTDKAGKGTEKIFLIYVMIAFGIALILLALQNLLARVIPTHTDKATLLNKLLSFGSMISMERNMKLASSFKINQMIRNARSVHDKAKFEHGAGGSQNSYGRILLTFSKMATEFEEVNISIWKRMWDMKLYSEEGIWLNNRMIQGNVGQLVLCIWLIPFLTVVLDIVQEFYESFLVNIAPEKWRILVPLALSFCVAEFNAIKLAVSYTPSSVRTTLRFRFGVLGSLHDKEFENARRNVDDASFIFGAMFWGCLLSSVFILIVSFLIFGLICFEAFLPILLQIVATILGIGITIGLKVLCLKLARRRFHEQAFYRSNPAAANIIGAILEAWTIGINTLYMAKRMIVLVGTAFIYVGRIDINFLGEDADQLGPIMLDNFPLVFRKDILSHEAHRHPYLERLGAIYMLKLRYGQGFGNEAGTAWRLLFVFALMPWLRKYRVRSNDLKFDIDEFNFSREGDVFKTFVTAKAGGYGRRPLSTVEESEDIDSEDNDAAIARLRKEVEGLKEENERLKMQRLGYHSCGEF